MSCSSSEGASLTVLLARTPRPLRVGGGGGVGRGVWKEAWESESMLCARSTRWKLRPRLRFGVAILGARKEWTTGASERASVEVVIGDGR